jgi:predicted GIY-YIG superfamily endonuclease/ribosomal protein L37E
MAALLAMITGRKNCQWAASSKVMSSLGQCYTLKLKSGKWYVGYTTRGIKRILEHLDADGAKWTKKYSPVEPIPYSQSEPGKTKATRKNKPNSDEDKLTLQLMEKHGIENVRGGSWCMSGKMKMKTIREIQELLPKTKCSRCGRESHVTSECYAKTHKNGGKAPAKVASKTKKAKCSRCGRDSHTVKTCNANHHDSGKRLPGRTKARNR